jgi:hypothetical protein
MKKDDQSFEEIWDLIRRNEGMIFYTKRGYPFTYRVQGNSITTSRTSWALSKRNIHHAFLMWPVKGPGDFNRIIRGPAYVWAILSDTRILRVS